MGRQSAILGTIPNATESSKSDYKNITYINRWFLTPLGVWPIQENGFIMSKILPNITVIICYFLIFFLLIPCGLHVFLVEKNLQKRMKFFGPMNFYVMAIFKYFFLILRKSKLSNCLNHIDVDWRRVNTSKDREIMINDAKIGRFIVTLCAIFMYSGGIFSRTILPFAVPRRLSSDNTTIRPLANPMYQQLVNTQKTPNYEITFITQWFGAFIIYTVTVAACSIAAVFTQHACGQLKIVMSRLKDFGESSLDTPQKLSNKIGEIVELHIRALKFVAEIQGILNEICFIEVIGCSMNICLLGYYILTEVQQGKVAAIGIITYSILITSFTFNIFIYCHIGELLTQQGKKIGTTAYMVEWYKLPEENASDMILILSMSNYPLNITAGKMVELSYATFCNVLKTAMAYFNLLRSVIL